MKVLKKRLMLCLFLFLSLQLFSIKIYSDSILLKKGTILYGKVIEDAKSYILFQSDYGKVKIDKDMIKEVTMDKKEKIEIKKEELPQKKEKAPIDDVDTEKNWMLSVFSGLGINDSYIDANYNLLYNAPQRGQALQYQFGIGATYLFTDLFSLSFELFYAKKSAEIFWEKKTASDDRKEIYHFHYLSLALLGRFNVYSFFYVGGGIALNLILGQPYVEVESGSQKQEYNLEKLNSNPEIKNDLGIILELGGNIPLNDSLSLKTAIKMETSFTSSFKINPNDTFTKEIRPRVYSLVMGINYSF